MLAHMRETRPDIAAVFVVDSQTGKLVNVDQAVFVPVLIDVYTGEGKYGVGDRYFIAFRSLKTAVVFAAASLPERPLERQY